MGCDNNVSGTQVARAGFCAWLHNPARADIVDYIEMFYNRAWRHSHLGGAGPEAFEQASS
ncbi:hypothetical protein F384_08405 [Citrobacter amalonaticus Y19]|uniref:Transposase n=1 Tax=Citrobacter amalonaticus Y19 TaxID=1261127 RepID=A0A0F6TV47_CITAM|nr:hypothetical protein F384_08405 [Citrobacter amalonaticus Y19]